MRRVSVEVNGELRTAEVPAHTLLSDFLRRDLGLTGTNVGCEHGVCGACTVQLDGDPVRSCLVLAVQVDGRSVRTVEGLADATVADGALHPLQRMLHERHGLQCGFCTPGILMTVEPILGELAEVDDDAIREALSGNLCRCTGYAGIVRAVREAAEQLTAGESADDAAG